MKKSVLLLAILIIIPSCAPKSEMPERIMEDGVEIVINRPEPYKIKGNLRLSLSRKNLRSTRKAKQPPNWD